MIEAGVAGFEVTSWFGLLAPAGTPAPIIAKLHQEAVKIVAAADMREKLRQDRARRRDRCAGRLRRDHPQRHAEVGEGDQGCRHQGGIAHTSS